MMKISLAEFIGGKEAGELYDRLCELTDFEWDIVKTCRNVDRDYDFTCSECNVEVFASDTYGDIKVSMYAGNIDLGDFKFCPNCGAKVIKKS